MFRALLLASAAAATLAPAAYAQTSPAAPAETRPAPARAPAPAQQPAATANAEAPPSAGQGGQTPAEPTATTDPAQADQATEVQAVTVTGARNEIRTSIDRNSYSLANDLQATSGSLADALRNVPQVQVDLEGNVSLRGDTNVRILVDGRPSALLNGDNRAQILQQMQAGDIERVEVITNPSAALSPEGSGGVINLVSRRNRRTNQQFASVRGNVDAEGRVNGGASVAYNTQRYTLTADAGFRFDAQSGESNLDRVRVTPGGNVESRTRGEQDNNGQMFNFRVGGEFNPDTQTRYNGTISFFDGNFFNNGNSRFEEENTAGAVARSFDRLSRNHFYFNNLGGQFGYRRSFEGEQHEFSADLSLERVRFGRDSRVLQVDNLPLSGTSGEFIGGDVEQDFGRIKIDYNRPLSGEGERLQVGYELEWISADFDAFGFRGPGGGVLPTDPNLTNLFLYDRGINSLYGTYQRRFGRTTAQLGLRVEQVNLDLDQVTTAIRTDRSDLSFFPTLHLRHELNDEQQLTASYSIRVQRPRPEQLNPFVFYQDPFNLRAGNPNLEDTETHAFELGWQYRRGQQFYLATAFYRVSDNAVTEVVEDLGGGVLLTTAANVAQRRSGGLELVANGRLTSELTYNASGSVFYEEFGGSPFGLPEQSGASWNVRGTLNWQPTERDFFQVNAFANGRRLLPQGYVEPFGVLGLGYRRKVNDSLSLVVTARDVLDSARQNRVVETPLFRERSENRFSQRALFFGFTYNFGQASPQQQRRDQSFDFGAGGAPGGAGPGG